MGSDASAAGRAYPYWAGWHTVGCAVLFFGIFGAFAVSLLPAGYDRVRTGDLPTGVAMMVLGVFGIPTLALSVLSLAGGVRDTFRPPLLKLTATELVLPIEARGEPPQNEHGEPLSDEPLHPEVIPLAAVRAVEVVGTPGRLALEISHDLSKDKLRVEQHMMRLADFADLEARLRALVPR